MVGVLLVDDTEAVRQVLKDYLQERGHEVTDVATGAAARDVLAAGAVGLLISDVRLPDCSGIDLATEADAAGVPHLLITGDFDSHELVLMLGMVGLRKPFVMAEFGELVTQRLLATGQMPPG